MRGNNLDSILNNPQEGDQIVVAGQGRRNNDEHIYTIKKREGEHVTYDKDLIPVTDKPSIRPPRNLEAGTTVTVEAFREIFTQETRRMVGRVFVSQAARAV